MQKKAADVSTRLEKARDTLLAAHAAMPRAEEVESLKTALQIALDRGYFTPAEDAQIKALFSSYLHVRSALHETLQSLRPMVPRFGKKADPQSLRIFLVGWLAGCMLMRSARYVVSQFYEIEQARKLLNQADPALGIPAGVFDQIHKGSTHPATLLRYLRAARYAESHQPDFEVFQGDKISGPLLEILTGEQPYIEKQKRKHAAAYAKCQIHRIRNKPVKQYHSVMWGLFEASGRVIAEMRNPFHRKRVRRQVRHHVAAVMQPGDILITRHDDAMSNLFLPGFWPHAAFIIGSTAQRRHLGVQQAPEQAARSEDPICILEAKKDGVRFRALRETLAVDAFMLLRPHFQTIADQRQSIERALSHEGKLYDFEFDFSRSDRLVCTEVVYRSLDGLAGFHFDLIRKAGRYTLPAETLLTQGLANQSLDIVLCYGLKGNLMQQGERAKVLIARSLQS